MAGAADKWDESPFGLSYKGDFECLKLRVIQNKDILSQRDDNKRMLTHWAALAGHTEIVNYLIEEKKCPVDPRDDMEMTPLILSVSAGKESTTHSLISHGADVNARNSEGHSSLQYAASKGWTDVVKMLLENQADINIVDKRGATPLHRAASKGNTNVVKLLLECGQQLKIDARDAYGNTALHLACEESRLEEAKLLTLQGFSLEIKNKEELTPLDLAKPAVARQLTGLSEQ